jgi:hypothetical protein
MACVPRQICVIIFSVFLAIWSFFYFVYVGLAAEASPVDAVAMVCYVITWLIVFGIAIFGIIAAVKKSQSGMSTVR